MKLIDEVVEIFRNVTEHLEYLSTNIDYNVVLDVCKIIQNSAWLKIHY
jgi:hypothetical protein